MKRKIAVALVVVCSLFAWSCYYNKEDELYGTNCDTSNVTYSGTVRSIINTYQCLNCHSGVAPTGGFDLETYEQVKAKVTDGRLYGAISHAPGYVAMPQDLPKMSSCDIVKMKAWIDAGTPNN